MNGDRGRQSGKVMAEKEKQSESCGWWGWVRRREGQVTKVEFTVRKHAANISFYPVKD